MTPRQTLVILALFSQTGCVAAIPMAAQLVSGANSTAQLCSMTKMPGQTSSLCDRFAGAFTPQAPVAPAAPAPHKAANGTVNTAER